MSDWELVADDNDDNDWELPAQNTAMQSFNQPSVEQENPWMSAVHGANSKFAKIFGFGPHVEQTREQAEHSSQINPTATGLGEGIAGLYSAIPFAMAGGSGILGSALAGGAYGGIQRPEEGESRLGNAATDAALWAALPALLGGYQGAKSLISKGGEALSPARYSQGKTVNQASKMVNQMQEYFREGYSEILSNPLLPEEISVDISPRILKQFKKGAPELRKDITRASQGTSLDSLHDTASQLGNFLRREKRALNPNKNAIEAAKFIKNKIEGSINSALDTVPGLKDSYRFLDKEFESTLGRVGPRIRTAIGEFDQNKIDPEDVMRLIRSPETGKYFRHRFGSEFPGISEAPYSDSLKNIPFIKQGYNIYEKYFGGK